MPNSETQEFERLNFLKRIVKKLHRRVCQTVLSKIDSECVRFSELKDLFQVFDKFVCVFSRSEEREEAAACLS